MTTDMTPYAGKHGTLVVGKSTLVGTVTDVRESDRFTFEVAGAESWYDLDMAWRVVDSFTPDAPPLPTKPGVYVPATANLDHGPIVFVLYGGYWRMSPLPDGADAYADAEARARCWHEDTGLVRLVREDSL